MKIAEHLTKPISKILKFLLRRLVFVTVAIILQMIWMTYMVVVIGEYSKAIEWVFRIFSITVVIYIANKDDNPAYKLAWTIPILLFPIFSSQTVSFRIPSSLTVLFLILFQTPLTSHLLLLHLLLSPADYLMNN